ncbi:hypothetical protein FOMG_18745, partial [Fusarium oxysporum f. sp. melonis 26406]
MIEVPAGLIVTNRYMTDFAPITVDLVLASSDLVSSTVKYMIHGTEHGSDHRAIETEFDVSVP